MPETIGEVWVKVRPDTAGFEQEAESKLGGALAGVAKVATVAMAGIGAAAGFGVKIAAENQTATIAFETMLGSAEKAQAFLDELGAFAAKTPFELPGLRTAASRLVAVGVETSKVIPLMSALGDATSAMGTGAEGIDRAVTALTQMQQKGKVTGEEMLQLAEAGIPAWDALATKLGVDVAQAQEMVSAGQVRVNDLMAAIETRAGPAFQKVQGMMEKQSATLTGLWSTLKDTVSQQLGGLAQPLVASLTAILPGITETIGGVLEGIAPLFEVFSEGLKFILPALDILLPAVGAFTEGIGKGLVQALQGIGPMLEGVASLFNDLLNNIAPLFPSLGYLVGAIGGALQPVFEAIGPAIGEVARLFADALGDAVDQVAELLPDLSDLLVALLDAVLPLLPTLAELATALIGPLLNAILPLLFPLVQLAEILVKALLPPLLPLIRLLTELAIGVLTPLLNLLGPIIGLLGTVVSLILQLAGGALGALLAMGSKVLEAVLKPIQGVFEAIGKAVEWVTNKVGDAIRALGKLGHALPEWLIPGSPSPLETTLWGIGSALRRIGQERTPFDFATPQLGRVGSASSGSAMGGGVGQVVVPVSLDGQVITTVVYDGLAKRARQEGPLFQGT
jgi:tape measure domain-containing protein